MQEQPEDGNDLAVAFAASSPATMAVLAAIPAVGGALTAFLATHGANIQRRRLERAMSALDYRLQVIEEQYVNLREEDLYDALLTYAEASARIDSDVMQEVAADILLGRLKMKEPPARPVQRYLAMASQLLPIELELCRAIYVAGSSAPDKLGNYPGLTEEEVRNWCQAIAPTGLLREAIGLGAIGYFQPTSLLTDLMAFLGVRRRDGAEQ